MGAVQDGGEGVRLINAYALLRQVSKNMEPSKVYLPIDFQEEIIEATTIDAIPVEWLKAQNTSTEYYKTLQGQAVELVLELWQKEQEAR